ncbi:MAG TPA: hypothetical protein VKB30_05885 [Candidatus Limnocylindrales bacterium]|nr:hypothetical protein [Candidatus Limnocylindrales bacterium]
MSPVLLLIVIVACLIAMIPVWRLRAAAWPGRWLFVAWLVYAIGIFAAVRAPVASRFLLPILVLAYVAPFVAGPERLTRVLRGRAEPTRPIVNVTPHPPTSVPPRASGEDHLPGDDDADRTDDTDTAR